MCDKTTTMISFLTRPNATTIYEMQAKSCEEEEEEVPISENIEESSLLKLIMIFHGI